MKMKWVLPSKIGIVLTMQYLHISLFEESGWTSSAPDVLHAPFGTAEFDAQL